MVKNLENDDHQGGGRGLHAGNEQVNHRVSNGGFPNLAVETRFRIGGLAMLNDHQVKEVTNVFRIKCSLMLLDVGVNHVEHFVESFLSLFESGKVADPWPAAHLGIRQYCRKCVHWRRPVDQIVYECHNFYQVGILEIKFFSHLKNLEQS